MDKKSREKWDARVDRAIRDAVTEAVRPPSLSLMTWLRSIGLSGIGLGAIGLTQSFFLPAVIAVYISLAVLVVDIYFERLPLLKTKLPVLAVLIGLLVSFTFAIVVRKEPIIAVWSIVNGRLQIVVENDSDDDYQNLDLNVRADFPDVFLADGRQETTMPGVTLPDPLPFQTHRKADSVMAFFTDPSLTHQPMVSFTARNSLEIRCEKLPKHSEFIVSAEPVKPHGHAFDIVRSIDHVSVDGSFIGKFRQYDFDHAAGGTTLLRP